MKPSQVHLPAWLLPASILLLIGSTGISAHEPAANCIPIGAPAVVYRTVWDTEYRERYYQVARPVWEQVHHEQRYRVRRPVETTLREETQVTYEPVTSHVTQYVDQGQWVDTQVQAPSRIVTRLRWVPGGWTSDPQTGQSYWKPGLLRPVRQERPGPVQTFRIWQPNVTPIAAAQTTFQPVTQIREVPVQTLRYVEQQQVRRVPVQVCRIVEEEVVQQIPVTTFRWVFEQRVERIPVRVSRVVAVPIESGPVGGVCPPEGAVAPTDPPRPAAPEGQPPALDPMEMVPEVQPQPTPVQPQPMFRPRSERLEDRGLVAVRD
jgi:hypothetical protein